MAISLREEVLGLLPGVAVEPCGPGVTAAAIQAFERRTRLPVPQDLRDWLQSCNGVQLPVVGLLGLRPEKSFIDIQARLARRPEWLALGWLPIAHDGCGNYYVL